MHFKQTPACFKIQFWSLVVITWLDETNVAVVKLETTKLLIDFDRLNIPSGLTELELICNVFINVLFSFEGICTFWDLIPYIVLFPYCFIVVIEIGSTLTSVFEIFAIFKLDEGRASILSPILVLKVVDIILFTTVVTV